MSPDSPPGEQVDPLHADPLDLDSLGVVADAIARADETLELAARHLDPSLVDVLRILGFDKEYVSARGSYLYDAAGRAYLDFHTGEGFASLGHNHPDVREVLQATLAADLVDGVQIHYSALAGMLAEELSRAPAAGARRGVLREHGRRGGRLGDEVRARGDRSAAADLVRRAAFTASRSGRCRWSATSSSRRASARCCPAASAFRSATSTRLEAELRTRDVAAFIVEPIQGRMVTLPPAGYLQGAQELCRRYGTLFVARRDPDRARAHGQVVRARALGPRAGLRARRQGAQRRLHAGRRDGHAAARSTSGPWARSSAATCTSRRTAATACRWRPAWRRCASSSATAWSSTPRASARCCSTGSRELQRALRDDQGGPRPAGLMIGIELGAPSSRVARLNWRLIHMASEGLFPQLIVIPLHRDHGVITMAAGQERRDQAAAAADALRGRGAQLPRRARRGARRLPRRGEQELGRSCATSPPPRCAARSGGASA